VSGVLARFSFLLYFLAMSSPLSSQSNFFCPFATVMSAHSLTLSRARASQSVALGYDIML
jgi:hypothetical protein